ncbi:MAG: translocation/assembly module TamB domain-containing protein [Saprospiraceae bacterium]|nr:translocation/assembly module TamB domain-containing protein [Saprospiraceae bacterium]
MLLQSSGVQTWITAKITNYISEATNTTITARRVKISPFDGLILDDVSILDVSSDTIFSGGAVNVSLRKNLFYLINNKLDLSYIGLKNIKINIFTEAGESKSNIQKFIEALSSSKKSTKQSAPLDLNLKEIDLSGIQIKLDNRNQGYYQLITLRGGNVDLNYLDWTCMDFDINEIILDKPTYNKYIYDYSCNIIEDLAIPQKHAEKDISPNNDTPISLTVRNFGIFGGHFGIANELVIPTKNYEGKLDYDNFYFDNIHLDLRNINFHSDGDVAFDLKILSAKDNTGYIIENIACDSIVIGKSSIVLPAYKIMMGKSTVKEKLSLSFADFSSFDDFANNVVINATFKDTRLYLEDLGHFIRSIGDANFVRNNIKEYVDISGRYFGKINNLAGRDVDIRMGDKLSLAGSFNTRSLLDPDNTVLNIRLERFQTSMRKIKMIVPSFNLPPNFNKLGSIKFEGRFDGYLQDFVAYGKLKTDLGAAELDMRLDISEGTNKAQYSGSLNLQNFNLGLWGDNPDFGLVNFKSKVDDGKGLTLNTVKTDLAATVKSLTYKNYEYKDFTIDGIIDRNTFKGSFKIQDKNIDFVFDGAFEYLNEKAFLNFSSDIRKIDLYALNLSKKPLSISGKMDINTVGNNINEFTGNLDIKDFVLQSKDSLYTMKQISIASKETTSGSKKLTISSDLGLIDIDGKYDLPNVVRSIKKVIYSNYPYITKQWKDDVAKFSVDQKFDFNINLENSRNYLSLLGLENSYFDKFSLKGKLDTYKNQISLASSIPYLQIGKDSINNMQILVTSDIKSGALILHIDSTFAVGKHFNPIDLHTNMKGDTVDFVFDTEKLIDSLANFDIKGRLVPHTEGYRLTLADNSITMLGSVWKINSGNNVIFGNKYLNIDNFILSDGVRYIEINDINNYKGLNLEISNFDLDIINGIINYDKMKFAGITNVSANVMDLFAENKEINGYVNIPKFFINGDPYGGVYIDITKPAISPLKTNISIGDFLAISGTYDEKLKYVDSRIKLRKAPLFLLEYLLKNGISDTEGEIEADMTFGGPLDNLDINGQGIINNAKTRIKFTGVTYYFDKQKVKLSKTSIDLNGGVITDGNGNKGSVKGGLVHNMFRNFGVNATISGNNVIGLNTTKLDNPNYYGYGIGQLSAEFKGSFDQLNMKINAVTGTGTKLYIPVGNAQGAVDDSFIKFVKKSDKSVEISKQPFVVNGINVEMSMTLTPEAEVSLIFNESKGDIIKGTGRGNIKIDITRDGDFEIFGDYEIEQGQYLFTVPLLPVGKQFVVQRGGTIRWTGDPINATLDITTNYRTRTPIKPFIEEYLGLAGQETTNLANQRTEVDLILKLGGTLFKPTINFDLSFPNLTSEIASFADNKIRILRSNELQLNSQVLGLIVFNTFLPSNRVSDVFGAAGLQSAGINTLSEFLSNQLSLYITNLLNSALQEGGLISGIDFELGVRNNNLVAGGNILPDEIEIRLINKFRFLEERLSFIAGGNYVFQNQGISVNQVLPDFALELVLTDDRKLKVRLYGKGDLDPITINGGSLRQKYGLGVAYRTEFGSMVDFEKKVKTGLGEILNK